MDNPRRILWVDDDGPDRFRYAESMLRRDGWEVEWAQDVVSAARRLTTQSYDAVLLDQETPLEPNDTKSRWAGCILLHWLRSNASAPLGLPSLELARHARMMRVGKPLADNVSVRVVVVSDYDPPELMAALRTASNNDVELPILPKPLNLEELRALLGRGR